MAKLQIVLTSGEHSVHDITEVKSSVGRVAGNVIRINDPSVSSSHAEIVLEGDKYHIHDLNSTNGTYINEEQVTDAILNHGDQIRIGGVEVVFEEEETVSEEPLPEVAAVAAEVAKGSSRPAGFVSTSPMPKIQRTKDPVAALLYAAVAAGILAVGAAAFSIYPMSVAG